MPRLTPAHLDEAFDALDHHDVVLGPATDGGYYLIGLTTDAPSLFQNISWGGPEVLTQTMQACDRIGLRYTLLEPLGDIDTPADLATWGRERLVPANRSPRVSVVIPARDEQDHLAATLASVLQARDVEVLLVDGESTDRTADIARAFGVTVLPCVPSRGVQLNLGASRSRGAVLLFVHADTLLPSAYLGEVFQTLCRPGVVAGAFSLRIDARGVAPRLIDFGVQLRSRLMQRPYGDQAMFMSREVFENAGGFPPLSCMEDYAMLDRLHALGAVRTSHRPVLTSARRWRAHGWMRVTLKHQWMILRHQLSRDRV